MLEDVTKPEHAATGERGAAETTDSIADAAKPQRRGGTWMQRWRVPLGFVCGALFLFFARPVPATLAAGGAVAGLGLIVRAWAAGHIRKNQRLAVTGPYAMTRNPLYLGSFVLGLGFTIASNRLPLVAVFALLFLGIYLPVMRVESRKMIELFGDEYKRYARRVPIFLPRLTPYKPDDANTDGAEFDGSLYLRYREYNALLGALGAWAILAAKILFS